jgi:hypothetical protein
MNGQGQPVNTRHTCQYSEKFLDIIVFISSTATIFLPIQYNFPVPTASIIHFQEIHTILFGILFFFFFISWRKVPAAVALLLPEDIMSGTQDDEPLPPYEDIDRSNPTDAAVANASQNEIYNDQKSAISTIQQVSVASDNYRSSRMYEFTFLSTTRRLLTRPSLGSAQIRTIVTKRVSMERQMLRVKKIRMLRPRIAIPTAE